jgi:hypothetical protein
VFSRPDTRGQLELARTVVDVVEQASSALALQFFGLIALQARIVSR